MHDIGALDGPRFFRMAWRIAAYDGMIARRIEAQNHEPDVSPTRASTSARRTAQDNPERAAVQSSATKGANVVALAAFSMMHPGLVERVQVPTTES